MKSNGFIISISLFILLVCAAVFAGISSFTGNVDNPSISSFSVVYDVEDVKFAPGELSGAIYPTIVGLRPSGRPGAPKLPMDTYTIVLPGKWNITGIDIIYEIVYI